MNYDNLSHQDFDAVVTGEITHYALWFEEEVTGIIADYFLQTSPRKSDFQRLLLQRDGLTFQDKIEIVRAMCPLFGEKAVTVKLKAALKRIEDFKSWRNALAHGVDVSNDDDKPELKVEVVSRSGKEKVVHITAKAHEAKLAEAEALLDKLKAAREGLSYEVIGHTQGAAAQ